MQIADIHVSIDPDEITLTLHLLLPETPAKPKHSRFKVYKLELDLQAAMVAFEAVKAVADDYLQQELAVADFQDDGFIVGLPNKMPLRWGARKLFVPINSPERDG